MICEFFCGAYADVGEESIIKFRMDTEKETIEKVFACTEMKKPSWITLNQDKTMLYAIQKGTPEGEICALAVTDTGLELKKKISSKAEDPCFLSLDSSERLMFVDHFQSGTTTVLKMGEDGLPTECSQRIVHQGKSVHPVKQTRAHCHYTKEHRGQVYTVDLGMDQIFVQDVDYEKGVLINTGKRMQLPPGSGPRHMEFNRYSVEPAVFYAVCEISGEVVVLEREGDNYVIRQRIGTLQDGQTDADAGHSEKNRPAAIKMHRNLLFVSNRGDDSITVFRILKNGLLERTQVIKSGGKLPRDFSLFDDYMVIANRDSDLITVLKVDWEKAELSPTGMEIRTRKPGCIRNC